MLQHTVIWPKDNIPNTGAVRCDFQTMKILKKYNFKEFVSCKNIYHAPGIQNVMKSFSLGCMQHHVPTEQTVAL